VVLFAIESDGLMPIACFDPRYKRVQGGADCLDLVPEGDSVATDGGRTLATGKRQEVSCPRGHSRQPGLGLPSGAPSESGHLAIWPKKALGKLAVVSGDLKPTATELGDLEALIRQTLSQESTDTLPGQQRALVVYTGATFDLDGDGVSDRMFSGVVDSLEGLRFTGLIAFLSTHGNKPGIIHRDAAYTYYLRGSVDLDGKGGREILVTRALVEHSTGAPTQLENAVGIMRRNDYRFVGLPCSLVPEGT
jgi:hypothetical protein